MRKNTTIAILLAAIVTLTGCMRIASETRLDGTAPHPAQRFYSGTKFLFGAPRELALGLGVASVGHSVAPSSPSDFLGGIFIGLPLAAVFATAFIVDLPLELVADTLFLPFDGVAYARYLSNPPLDKYVYDNDLEGMKAALEKGANPNVIDPLFIKKEPVIYTAFSKGNEAAFGLLLEHGAKIPFSILQTCNIYSYNMLSMAFKDGCPRELLDNDSAKYLVSKWIQFHLGRGAKNSKSVGELVDILELLMGNGFPPVCEGEESGIYGERTSLDIVLDDSFMETSEKDRLVAAMRAYGAKRYCEIHNQEPPSGHLKTDGLRIDAMFQPVVDVLERSKSAGLFSLKDSYPDIDGPVLVIDKPFVESYVFPKHKIEYHYRKDISFRRRVSETEWASETETLDIPANYRIVLTPTGKRLPSRRPKGMPAERGFWEAWYTLPTCEMHVEHAMSCGKFPNIDLLRICLLPMQLEDDRELIRCIRFEPEKVDKPIMDALKWPAARNYSDNAFLDGLVIQDRNRSYDRQNFIITDKERQWLSKASKGLAAIGIAPEWRKFINNSKFAFSTRRDLAKTTKGELPLAPYPDEIVVAITPFDSAIKRSAPLAREGKDYWNMSSRPAVFPLGNPKGTWKGGILIYHGDAVTEKRLEEVFKALEKLK